MRLYVLLFFLSFAAFAQRTSIEYAEWVASRDAGKPVHIKAESLFSFGKNVDLTTALEDVWIQGGTEYFDFGTANLIDSMSSSDAGDAQIVTIKGATIDGSDSIALVTFNDTLNGQTPVVLNTALYRIFSLENAGATSFAGDIYVYSGGTVTAGVPQTADSIHLKVRNTEEKSYKSQFTTSSREYYFITSISGGVEISGGTKTVDCNVEVKRFGELYKQKYPFSITNSVSTDNITFDPPIIIYPRSDVKTVCISSGASTLVEIVVNGYKAVKKL